MNLEYDSSNSELIEALLNEKERDKNIKKVQREKYEQLFKNKQEEGIEIEDNAKEEQSLLSLYEKELMELKRKLETEREKNQREEGGY